MLTLMRYLPLSTTSVFFSYSTLDADLAGEIRDSLDELGIDTFLAHRTIVPSKEWRIEIKSELIKRNVFILLLTPNTHTSDWIDQEVGMAIAQRKTIIPVSAPTAPYGFVADFQAVDINPRDSGADLWRIIKGIANQHVWGRKQIRRRTMELLCQSSSFHQSRNMLRILDRVFSPLTRVERKKIYEASMTNDQIAGYTEVVNFIQSLDREFE